MHDLIMPNVTPDHKKLLYKTVLFSFLLHLVLAKLFVFTFTDDSNITRPSFIFLGSILEKEHFLMRATNPNDSTPRQTITVKTPKTQDKMNDPYDELIGKPSYIPETLSRTKTVQKSVFYEEDQPVLNRKEPQKILGIDVLVPKRKPLRLK